eukprot:CAMPEP_0183480814 /NCGR_PEP_ID=MMETSP0370-20130417/173911_1 /TAXON_ID=268820 /ORGANISM="Peridinium aciculiferum, Strain PAER-2" /LENGTH=38 /DNA_ID= /DNA_START= /DNA_END= /DNA_ORIENTATION=
MSPEAPTQASAAAAAATCTAADAVEFAAHTTQQPWKLG